MGCATRARRAVTAVYKGVTGREITFGGHAEAADQVKELAPDVLRPQTSDCMAQVAALECGLQPPIR